MTMHDLPRAETGAPATDTGPGGFKGRLWHRPDGDAAHFKAIRERVGDPLLARVLMGRGVEPATLSRFLEPRIKTEMVEPYDFLGMEAASKRLADAIGRK